MEIVLLLVLWAIAAFSAELRDFGFSFFLVFVSIGVMAWRWRAKLADLRSTLEVQAHDADSLRAELRHVMQELRLLKSALASPLTPAAPDASQTGTEDVNPLAPAPAHPPAAHPVPRPEPVAEQPVMPEPPRVQPAPVPSTPVVATSAPTAPAVPPSAPTRVPAPGFAAQNPVAPSAPVAEHVPATPVAHQDMLGAPVATRTAVPPPPAFKARAAASKPSSPQKLKKALDLEELVGRNLLPKAGIFLLVIGSVSLIATQWQNIPAFGKDLLLLAAGGLLLGLGIFLEKREKYELFGRVLIGGGWAMLFYTSYALYHVSATRILPSQGIDLLVMLATAGTMVWHTLKYRSQLVTGVAYLLAFSTVTLSEETVFSLTAGAVLALSLVVLVQRMRWYELEVFGILASYLNHFRFLFPIIGMGIEHRMFPEFYASTGLLVFYWAVFRASYVMRPITSKQEENVSTLACLLNPFLLLALMKYQSVHPQLAFYALLVLGALEFSLGQLPITRRRRIAFLILTTLGSTMMIAAVPFKFSGMNTAVLWLAGAEALLISGILVREVAFRRLGMIAGLLTTIHILAVDVRPWFEQVLRGAPVPHDLVQGTLPIFCAAVLFVDAHLLELRWKDLFHDKWDRWLKSSLSYAGGLVGFLALWITLPSLAVAVGWAALMFVLAFAAKRLERLDLTIQTALLGLCAGLRVFVVNLQADTPQLAHTRLWTVATVAAIFYLSARFASLPDIEVELRAAFQWTGTAIVAALLWVELPLHWVAACWTLFAIVLTLVGRQLRLRSLLYQCYALSAAALITSISVNWPQEQSIGRISLRLVTVSLVAAGFYLLSVIARTWTDSGETDRRGVAQRAAFNTGAALLLGGLIWYEAGEMWSAVLWSAFATALLVLWRRLNFTEFYWQAHALALAAFMDVYGFDMFTPAQIHGMSARLITVTLVGAMFYLDAWLASKDVRTDWPARIRDFYCWTASLLATTLMWHELRPIDVALGWAIFAIVLFEVGLERRIGSLRWQGGVALVASFTRIFFVNLNAVAEPGHLSPRVYTILPLAAIYLYIYWRTLAREEAFGLSRWKELAPMLFSSLGVASIAFLIRFEAQAPNVVVFWAALTLVLLAVARWLGQAVFLYQAIVLAISATVRAMLYNLVTPSYFSRTDVRARTVGEVIALFFVSLVFAFRLRNTPPPDLLGDGTALRRWLGRISARPEQLFFFAAVALLTPLIAIEMKHGEITVGWGIEAVLVFMLALAVGERSFRLCGLGLLLLCLGKLMFDVWNMNTGERTISMTVLGAVLLLVSFLYSRYREAIRKYL